MCSMAGTSTLPGRLTGTVTGEALLRMDMQDAEALFNKLPLQQQQQIVLNAPWSMRQDLIMRSAESRVLVQELPEDEVYWMIKERGIEDSLPVISRTSQEQFQFLTDIDCWARDELDPERSAEWLLMLSKCNEHKVIEWLTKTDPEFLVLCLKSLISVRKVQGDTDISEEYVDLPAFTIDNVYFCAFKHESAGQCIPPFLHLLFQQDYAGYTSILESIIWDPAAEVQDDAYRWRCSRIADKGYPDIDEAQAVYRIVSDSEVKALKLSLDVRGCADESGSCTQRVLLRYGFNAETITPYMAAVLNAIEDVDALDRLQADIAVLANKILVADVLDNRRSDDMLRALQKVLGYVTIALEDLTGGSIAGGVQLLYTAHPEVLFQIGFSRIVRLQQMLCGYQGRFWIHDQVLFKLFYPSRWLEIVEGLLKKRALCSASPSGYRDFVCLEDVLAAERIIAAMMAADHILFTVLGLSPEQQLRGCIADADIPGAPGLTCQTVFITVLAQKILTGHPVLEPWSSVELQAFLQKVCSDDMAGCRYRLNPGLAEHTMQWLQSEQRFNPLYAEATEYFVRECLNCFEDEFSRLRGNKTIDYRYVPGILLQRTDNQHPDGS
jgi:hypothetical protein